MALFSTLMIFLHGLPVENDSEFGKSVEQCVAKKNNKIKILSSERATVIIFEHLVSNAKFVRVFAVKIKKNK